MCFTRSRARQQQLQQQQPIDLASLLSADTAVDDANELQQQHKNCVKY